MPCSRAARAASADGRDLRHSRAGDHARGADGAGSDAHLDGVGAGLDQRQRALVGGHVAGQQAHLGKALLHLADRLQHARGVAVRRVDGQHIHARPHQFRRALQKVAGGPDGSADAQPALIVLAGVGILQLLLDVLDRDQALQIVLIVHHQQLFHAVLVQDQLGLFQRGAHRNGDQVLLGHHVADGNVGAGLKAQVAVGEDAHQLLALRHRHAGDLVAPHHFQRVADHLVRADGHRVHDHAALRALHLVDLAGLVGDGQIAVHNADAALLRHGDGHARLGHRVHGRREQRRVQRDVAGQLGLRAHLHGHHVAVGGHQQHIVEGKGFG